MITNTDNIILTGDWNCVLSAKDTTNIHNTSLSKSLKNIVTGFKYKDVYTGFGGKSEFTYYKNDYASRLDRIYLNRLHEYICDVKTQSTSFSDHLSVSIDLNFHPTYGEVSNILTKK